MFDKIRLNDNFEKKEEKDILFIILGINKFIENLGSEKERFTQNLNLAKSCENCSFIVVDSSNNIKAHALDSWYKNFVVSGNGIYIGNGFDSQYAIAYEADRKDINGKCGDSMGYIVRKSKPHLVKFLGIEEKSEEDE